MGRRGGAAGPPRAVGLVAVVLAVVAVGVTTTALGVVARSVADDLDVGAVPLGWAVNAYLVVAASFEARTVPFIAFPAT